MALSALRSGRSVAGFYDDFPKSDSYLGLPVYSGGLLSIPGAESFDFHVAIGNNGARRRVFESVLESGLDVCSIIDPASIVDTDPAMIGAGCYIGRMAVVGVDVSIGPDTIVNTKALVEHGCRVGSHCNVSTSSVLNGDVILDDGVFFGSCASCNGQHSIGCWSVVGAGSVIVRDVPRHVTVAGVPARIISGGDDSDE